MFRPTRALIDRSALRHNLSVLRGWTGKAFFCPMVKANAYGHDELIVAREVEGAGCDAVGVALIEEGVRLRSGGIRLPVVVFAPFRSDGAEEMVRHGLTPVVGRLEELEALRGLRPAKPVDIHLKFNTGMQRLGFGESELAALLREIESSPHLIVRGVCTHLTHGEEFGQRDGPSTRQVERFLRLTREFSAPKHLHKTASLAAAKSNKLNLGSRPGIGIYGLPHEGLHVGEGLRPVLSWVTELAVVRRVAAGETVGYSNRWTASRPSVIGVLPVGYADGYMRGLSNRGEVLFRGRRVPVVGGVCMDYVFVDLTDAADDGIPAPGEAVTIIGRQGDAEISAQDVAEKLGTIAYEVVTAISRRVPREAR